MSPCCLTPGGCDPDPPACPALSCPAGVGPGSGFGNGAMSAGAGDTSAPVGDIGVPASMEEDAPFIAQLFVDYLLNETLPDALDTSGMSEDDAAAAQAEHTASTEAAELLFATTVSETIAWLDVYLAPAEKAGLVAQLSSITLSLEIPIAEDLVAGAITIFAD